MAENEKLQLKSDKKLLENPFVGSLIVPIAIVLVGALIIFGVTKMLSTDQSYKDLVREMESKTFGNKWVAALELSKVISSKQIPDEDIPWLITSLTDIYKTSVDSRTRDFIVVALGALRSDLAVPTLKLALDDKDSNVKFHAVVALSGMPQGTIKDWSKVQRFLSDSDQGLVQAVILTLGTHRVESARPAISEFLTGGKGEVLKFAAATALIAFKEERAVDVIKEILFMKEHRTFNVNQVSSLKLNVLSAIGREKWMRFESHVERLKTSEKDLKVATKAAEVLNQLKN